MLKYIALGLIGIAVALMVYVRVAPLDAAQLHAVQLDHLSPEGEFPAADGHTAVRRTASATASLSAMDEIIMATPRTSRIAGSIEEGRITYVTRSRWMGFPDITTVDGGFPDAVRGATYTTMIVYGRLRFGKADMGVNRARITRWLAQYDEGTT